MILIYLADETQKEAPIRRIMDTLQLKTHFLSDAQTNVPLKVLFDDPHATGTPKALAHPIMVLHEISDEQFTAFNDAMKQQDAYISRKAMRTIHNQNWTLERLSREIEDEHRYFQRYDQLQQLIGRFMKDDPAKAERYAGLIWHLYVLQKWYEDYRGKRRR